ncbi:MAG: FKBP-type peptidyl-prolyl cis-trans isomerase [Actinomycetes bacterium]
MSIRTGRALAVLATSVVVLVGTTACGSDPETTTTSSDTSASPSVSSDSASPSPSKASSSSDGEAAMPTVKGGFGKPPTITVPDADPPSDLVVKVLSEGDGADVASGDLIVVDYLGVRWDDGATFDSSFDRGPAGFSIGTGAVIPGWDAGLVGLPVGSRVMLVAPPDQAYGDTPPGDPIQAGDTLVFVIDILGAHKADETAKGEPAPTEDDSLPSVSITPKEPEIVMPSADPVNRLIALPVVVGDGPKVQKGQTIVVQYKGALWRTGKEFDSSWSRGQPYAVSIGTGSVIPGWDKGLVGQTVGSRVLLVVPPKDGYGKAGQGPIKGTDTMVFAVDILGAY